MALICGGAFEEVDHWQRPSVSGSASCPVAECRKGSRLDGYTLLEMMIVVALLAIAAAIAVPSITAAEHHKLALAGSEVADALRFAREESRRTGVIHGVSTDISINRITVFRLDEGPNPNLKIFDVYQPVSKQLYSIELGAGPHRGVTLSTVGGQFVGTCNDPGNIAFDRSGVVRCTEPTTTRIQDAEIDLVLGSLLTKVVIDSYSGRVSVQ